MQFLDFDKKIIPPDQLPRLMVLTGLNGSGKTRGLKALQSADQDGTQYINYRDFSAKWDESSYTDFNSRGEIVIYETINDWKYQTSPSFGTQRYEDLSNDADKLKWIKANSATENFARLASKFFEIFPESNQAAFKEHGYLLSIDAQRAKDYWDEFEEGLVPRAYKDASIKKCMPVHCLADKDVLTSLDLLMRLKHPLNLNLVALANDYSHQRNKFFYESAINNISDPSNFDTFRKTVPDPFIHINDILKRLADNESMVFQFTLQSDPPETPPTYEKLLQPSDITIRLIDNKTGDLRNLDELSSGEQTLLALTSLIYTHKYIQPMRALYLDEIDASLHPSMIRSMLEILQEQTSETRIFLATHSPSTVALAPMESLFFVDQGSAKQVDRTEALEGLTQGYSTIEGISSVFRSIKGNTKKVIVISEGHNFLYLKAMLKKLNIDAKCHIHEYKHLKSSSKGVTELKVLYGLFCDLVDTLPMGKQFVFLIDCEESVKVAEWGVNKQNNFVKAICLQEIASNPVKRGIENVVPQFLFVEIEKQYGLSIYKNTLSPEGGIKDKTRVEESFIKELNLPASRIDIGTLKHTLAKLIDICSDQHT